MKKKKGKRTNRKYSPEFKLAVVKDIRKNYLTREGAMRKYFPHLKSPSNNSFLRKWERIFLEEGAEGLMLERRGRKVNGKKRGRPPKLERQVEEDLIAENQHLRAENDYLKKLDALIQEREKRENEKKPK